MSGAVAPSLVYDLPSVVERLDLGGLFPVPQPLEIELGSGDGSFLAAYAALHPERNFIGVERLLGAGSQTGPQGSARGLGEFARSPH